MFTQRRMEHREKLFLALSAASAPLREKIIKHNATLR